METLLKNEFKPTRTVILAFGFDEEISGYQVGFFLCRIFVKLTTSLGNQGAGNLAPAIEAIYGKNGIGMLVDEGCKLSSLRNRSNW